MARRTLTIGEAAAALAGEFPGISAAVLRRLEAAGQFIPARSSSGYRRYSEADLDLIRIVLSNQPAQLPEQAQAQAQAQSRGQAQAQAVSPAAGGARTAWAGIPDPADLSGAEHPLTHPAAGQSGAEDAFAAVGAARDLASGAAARHGGHPGPQGSGSGSGSGPAAGRTAARGGRAASSRVPAARSAAVDDLQGTASRSQGEPRPTTEALFDVPPNGAASSVGGVSAAQSPVRSPGGSSAGSAPQSQCADLASPFNGTVLNGATANGATVRATTANGAASTGATARATSANAAPSTAVNASGPAPSTAASTTTAPSTGAAPSTAASRRAERRWPDPEFFAPDLGEVALDRDQLAAAARTDRAWVDGLVEYGLLSGNQSAGGADLLVARAAAELAQFGMEPRHLRAVAASAARVAELIASATSPGPARDAARRERTLLAAPGRSAEAAAAAVRLHAALVRAALLRG